MRKGWEGIHYSNARNFYAAYGVELWWQHFEINGLFVMRLSFVYSVWCCDIRNKSRKEPSDASVFFFAQPEDTAIKKRKRWWGGGYQKLSFPFFRVLFFFYFDVIFARLPHDPSWSQRRRRNVKRKNFCFQWEKTWWSILSFLNIHLKTWVRRQWPCRKRKLLFRTRHKHFEVARKSGLN